MEISISRLLLLLLLTPSVIAVSTTPIPRGLQWSSKTYGPDGPWHAVTVEIGSPSQSIDLFPGGFWQSNVLGSQVCTGVSPCYASSAGVYNELSSDTVISNISETGSVDNSTFSDKGELSLFGSGDYAFDVASIVTEDPPSAAVTLSAFDMLVISEGYETLPDGTQYAIEVGNLALGAPEVNQSWTVGEERFNASLLPSSLYLQGLTESNSFGMHIGSTALEIPPSLYIGGYDQTRVLGNVTVQDYNMHYFPIDLLDIGIGVAEGQSPFDFESRSGLLAYENSSVGVAMQVLVDPIAPYLYLPRSTCDAITQYLPVLYQPNLGLYFWDTNASDYQQIISTPSFLSFTFRLNSSITQNMTINVPFSLLNLTLTAPLVKTPTQYFPCNPFDWGKSYNGYALGKAFLQAAFLGVNWQLDGLGNWFLAQAPGPNTPSQPVAKSIGLNDAFVEPSDNDWADTWKGAWTPRPYAGTITFGTAGRSGLSKGAIAGIVVGCLVAVGLLIGAVLYYRKFSKRRTNERSSAVGEVEWERKELDSSNVKRPLEVFEMAYEPLVPRELDGVSGHVELPG